MNEQELVAITLVNHQNGWKVLCKGDAKTVFYELTCMEFVWGNGITPLPSEEQGKLTAVRMALNARIKK